MTNFKRFALGFRFDSSDIPKPSEDQLWNICFGAFSAKLMEGLELHLYRQEHSLIDPTDAYICIISKMSLARSKKIYDAAKRSAALTGALTLYRPYVQLNYLELLDDFEFLGIVAEDGTVRDGDVSYGAMCFTGPEYEKLPNRKKNPFVLIVPDRLDDDVTSAQAIRYIRKACRETFPYADIRCIPVSDGGKGTMDAITTVKCGRYVCCQVHDQQLDPCTVYYAVEPDETAVVEVAQICDKPGVLRSSYGVGEMIRQAADSGYENILLACGENEHFEDRGLGCLEALGMLFYDENGESISILEHDDIERIAKVDTKSFEQNTANIYLRILANAEDEANVQNDEGTVERVLSAHYGKSTGCGMVAMLKLTVKTEIFLGAATVAEIVDVQRAVTKADIVVTACKNASEVTNHTAVAGVIAEFCREYKKALAILTTENEYDVAVPEKTAVLRMDTTLASERKALERAAAAIFNTLKIGQSIH